MAAYAHKPTDEIRQKVKEHAGRGVPHLDIARILRMSNTTLLKHYDDELKTAKAEINSEIAGLLYTQAKNGNIAAMIFWLKAQAGWRETTQQQHLGKDGKPVDPTQPIQIIAGPTDQKL